MVRWKTALVIGVAAGASYFVVLLVIRGGRFNSSPAKLPGSWNQDAIQATYVSSQLRQIDKALAGLFLSYDLENNTDRDYRLVDAPGVVIMSRLKSDHSLSQEELIRLSYPAFLPASQRVRIAIEISYPFVWPAPGDPALKNNLTDFLNQRLSKVE